MKAKVIAFGEIEIEGRLYAHDVVIEGGEGGEASQEAVESLS